MVLVRLVLVLLDLLADVVRTLLQGIRHAVGPGDGALLPAVELLQEKAAGAGRALTAGLRPPPGILHPALIATSPSLLLSP